MSDHSRLFLAPRPIPAANRESWGDEPLLRYFKSASVESNAVLSSLSMYRE